MAQGASQDTSLDFRTYLRRELLLRTRRNPRYSLRAFARDLGMAPSKVSEILRGQAGISGAAAARISKKLAFPDAEARLFVTLVELGSRSQLKRREAERKLAELRASHGFNDLELERFTVVSEWYHGAILELTRVDGFRSDPGWIASRLGLSRAETSSAVARLLELGLLRETKDGRWEPTEANLATPSGIPSRAIRAYHSQILHKADHAIEAIPVEERDFSALTLAINSSQLEEAREELRKFRRRFCSNLQSSPGKDRVYCLSIQFFPVDKVRGAASRTSKESP